MHPPVKNGPALSGYGAVAMNERADRIPGPATRPATPDRSPGTTAKRWPAMPAHPGHRHPCTSATPHSPWQRGTNENTNGLLREYFPKGTDLARWSAEDLEAVALAALNNRPLEVLGWKAPGRSLCRTTTLAPKTRCCTDRLNSPNTPRWMCAETLMMAGSKPSIGSVGRRLRQRPGRDHDRAVQDRSRRARTHPSDEVRSNRLADVELLTADWVHWYNTSRLMHRLDRTPPAEYEAPHYAERATAKTEAHQ